MLLIGCVYVYVVVFGGDWCVDDFYFELYIVIGEVVGLYCVVDEYVDVVWVVYVDVGYGVV